MGIILKHHHNCYAYYHFSFSVMSYIVFKKLIEYTETIPKFKWKTQEVVLITQNFGIISLLLGCHHVWLPQRTFLGLSGFESYSVDLPWLISFSPHKNYPYWCMGHGSFSLSPLYIYWICQSACLPCHLWEFELFLILVIWTLLATTIISSWPFMHCIYP